MKIDLKTAQRIHFIGIGGIGISAIARMLKLEGKEVSGSDRDTSEVIDSLEKAGIHVVIGQKAENIPKDCDLVIYTVAIPDDNPELHEAKKRGIALMTYPQTLNVISKEKYTIAVSGTHGKTTTTAMAGAILSEAGLDPTVIVGSLIKDPEHPEQETNFISGKSKYFIVEADEYKKSFHNLEPHILVINNLDVDHLDFYKDLEDIQNSFRELALKVPQDGYLICDVSNPHLAPVIETLTCIIINYAEYAIPFNLPIPGAHNKSNARAAASVAKVLGVSDLIIRKALENFKGPWRRFEYKGTTATGAKVYDDYAHNPHKVRAAIEGAREAFPDKKIIVAFQPHLFSRTKLFLREFADALATADHVFLAPIYPAREIFDPTISSDMLALEVKKLGKDVVVAPDLSGLEQLLLTGQYDSGSVIVVMGAGDIYTIAKHIVV